jgi:hypothetical protein
MYNKSNLLEWLRSSSVFMLCLFYLGTKSVSYGQANPQVLMQAWYWDYPKTGHGASWADTLINKAAPLKESGFSHIWFPPHAVASFGIKSNGYDPQDLFIGNATTGLGTRPKFDAMMNAMTTQGLRPVADMIYNHRDGGRPQNNNAVKAYINNHYNTSKSPFPSDRFRCILPLGGSTGNGAGDYYFKISSKTGGSGFNGKTYQFYTETRRVGRQNLTALSEVEPNGGGDCSQANNTAQLGRVTNATLETTSGCNTDEFRLSLSASDFHAAGDTLFIFLNNTGSGGYSDHRIYGIWRVNTSGTPAQGDVVSQLEYQTYTDFSGFPSGRGQMSFESFRPNTSNASTENLSGDQNSMLFFYDYDQNQSSTRDTLIAWTKWNWDRGTRGLRMDAIKHFGTDFVGDMLNSMHADNKIPDMVVGEWYGSDPGNQANWINAVNARMNTAARAAIKPKVFDFTVRQALKEACDFGTDPRNAFNNNLRASGVSGFNIITFLDNHDFRAWNKSAWDAVVHDDAILGYAFLLTNNQIGVPTVFYPNYYGYPVTESATINGQSRQIYKINNDTLYYDYYPQGRPAYKTQIDQLIKILRTYIDGSQGVDYLNNYGSTVPSPNNYILGTANKSMIYQMHSTGSIGGKEVIVAVNFGTTRLRVDHKITETRNGIVRRNVPGGITGTTFKDLLGNSAFSSAVVDEQGRIYMDIPPKSYSVWVQDTCPVNSIESVISGNWTDPLTWACGKIPTATDDVKINAAHTVTVDSGIVNAKNLNNLGKIDLKNGSEVKLNP